jgi:hypothetical protein
MLSIQTFWNFPFGHPLATPWPPLGQKSDNQKKKLALGKIDLNMFNTTLGIMPIELKEFGNRCSKK